jgi:hypothetical protein
MTFGKNDNFIKNELLTSQNFLQSILFRLIPKISKEIIILILKIFLIISAFSMIFLTINNLFFIKHEINYMPKSFSDDGETLLSEIYVLFLKYQNLLHDSYEKKIILNYTIYFSYTSLALFILIFAINKIFIKQSKQKIFIN